MLTTIIRNIKGIIVLPLLIINLMLVSFGVLTSFALTSLIPFRKIRYAINLNFIQKMPSWYMTANRLVLSISTAGKWDIEGEKNLKPKGWYFMISNHQSWIDIIVLGTVFNYVIPSLKFFMKKELMWQLPFAGLTCYVLGYPFIARHSHAEIRKNPKLKGKDIETTKKACKKLRDYPATLINFVEGTRFTQKKYEKQNSPFKHLLKPRAGGISISLQELHDKLDGIVNVSILYPGKKPSVWEFVCGNFKKVVVRYELIPITDEIVGDYLNNRAFRAQFQQWLNIVWQRNDALLDELVKRYEK